MSEITGFPISPQQAQLWQLLQQQANGAVPAAWVVVTLDGVLDAAMQQHLAQGLDQPLNQLVAGEETLRTDLVCLSGMNEPLQVVREQGESHFSQEQAVDLKTALADAQHWCEQSLTDASAQHLHARLYDVAGAQTVLALRTAATLADSYSLTLLAHDLLTSPTQQQERLQYADYAAWRVSLREESAVDHPGLMFWQTREQQPVNAPKLRLLASSQQTSDNASNGLPPFRLTLDAQRLRDLRAYAVNTPLPDQDDIVIEEGLFILWTSWLARLADRSEIAFTLYDNHRGEELTGAIGPYRQALPFSASVDLQASLADNCDAIITAKNQISGWRDYYSGTTAITGTTDYSFEYQNQVIAPPAGTVIRGDHHQSLLHLNAGLHDGQVVIHLHGDATRVDSETFACLCEQWQRWVGSVPAAPHISLHEHNLLGERQQARFQATPAATPRQAQSVVALIQTQAEQHPDAPAVAFNEQQLSYSALNRRANQLAHYLRNNPITDAEKSAEQEVIGVLLPRSLDMMVAILGVMKGGAAYLPLDPTYPAQRIKHLIEDSGVRRVIYHQNVFDGDSALDTTTLMSGSEAIQGIDLAQLKATLNALPADNHPEPALDDLAYVIYTSGSTGQPKGVEITHGALSRSTQTRGAYYPQAVSAYLLLSSFAFDSSVAGIFWTLSQGGLLVLPAAGEELQPKRLAALIQQHQISHSLCLPSLYEAILDQADLTQLHSLRAWIVAGEACPNHLPAKHRGKLPQVSLYNEYGPTEATVWATVDVLATALDSDQTQANTNGDITIGRAIPGMHVFVLNDAGVPAALGEPGEIYLGGKTLARGYRHQPQQTAAQFTEHTVAGRTQRLYRTGDRAAWRLDGRLDFLGRRDGQVKIRGHRVELGEIERVLLAHKDIAQAAALIKGERLLAYLVPRHGYTPDTQALRQYLSEHLPVYMQPHALISLSAMPRGPNGKLDTQALPDEEHSGIEYVAPRNDEEAQLAAICAQVLNREQVGVFDNFFQIGGDSILSLQVVTRALQQGIDISARQIFDAQTVAAMAQVARFGVTSTNDGATDSATGSNAVAQTDSDASDTTNDQTLQYEDNPFALDDSAFDDLLDEMEAAHDGDEVNTTDNLTGNASDNITQQRSHG